MPSHCSRNVSLCWPHMIPGVKVARGVEVCLLILNPGTGGLVWPALCPRCPFNSQVAVDASESICCLCWESNQYSSVVKPVALVTTDWAAPSPVALPLVRPLKWTQTRCAGNQKVLLMWLMCGLCARRRCGGRGLWEGGLTMNGQGCGRKRLWRSLRYCTGICLEGMRTTTTNHKRRTGVPTMWPWCVLFCCDCWRELLRDGFVTGTMYWSPCGVREISEYFEH